MRFPQRTVSIAAEAGFSPAEALAKETRSEDGERFPQRSVSIAAEAGFSPAEALAKETRSEDAHR